MPEQLVFDLPVETAFGRDDFFTSAANAVAVARIEASPDWALGKLVLVGPEGSGKSHLAQIWADDHGAVVINANDLAHLDLARLSQNSVCVEDVPHLAGQADGETALFHLHNFLAQNGQMLLMTGRDVPKNWGIQLPDLSSRIGGAQLARLDLPDDCLLMALLVKLLEDRQLQIEPGMIDYILPRIERSFAAVRRLVVSLDHMSLQRKRPIGPRMVGQVLKQLEQEDEWTE